MVERGCAHANDNVRRAPELWLRQVFTKREVLGAAMRGERECFQSRVLSQAAYIACYSLTHEPVSSP
jgi:hypothetical protein